MEIYLLNLLLIIFWHIIFSYKKNEVKEKYFLFIVGLQLVLLGGLRSISVGTDTIVYAAEYDFFKTFKAVRYTRIEYGYIAIMTVLNYFNLHFNWLLFITSSIIVFLVFKSIKEYSSNIFLSVYLFVAMYLYYYSFNVMRQCIAVAICFFCYKYILKREAIKYVLGVLLAAQFHTTAYIMLPLYFVYMLAKQRMFFLVFLVILYFIFIFINPFVNFVLQYMPRYLGYLDSVFFDSSTGLRYVFVYGIILLFGYINLVCYKIEKRFLLEFLYMSIAFLLNLLALNGYAIFARLAWYFTIYTIIFLPNCLSRIKNKYFYSLSFLSIFILSFCYHYYFLTVDYQRITPYEFIGGY